MTKSSKNKLIIVILFFGILYSLISLVNHYNFRTYALDLGAYTNALYDYIHFQWNDSTVFKETGENLLADHFDLYLIIFSPFSLIFGTYALLILQIVFLLFGGIGTYSYFRLLNKNDSTPIFATIYFYAFFGVFAALSYDYHSNVIAASLVPWFFYLLRKRKLRETSIVLLIILVSKENISFWLAFVCIGLAIEYRKDKYLRNYTLAASLFCIAYFISIVSFVMPAFSNNNLYPHFNYSILGNNFLEALFNLIKHPLESIKILFTNHTNHPNGNFIKTELHLLVLFSGLPLLLRKPQYLIMLVPVYFQKLFHDNYYMWSIGGQYCIEFAPILAIGIFSSISDYKNYKAIKIVSVAVLLGAIFSTLRTMDSTIMFTDKSRIRFYQKSHYTSKYNVKLIHKELSAIPKNAIASVQSPFLPHLALRDMIYQFPIIKDAEYIVYSKKEISFPLDKDQFIKVVNGLEESGEWSIITKESEITILKRNFK